MKNRRTFTEELLNAKHQLLYSESKQKKPQSENKIIVAAFFISTNKEKFNKLIAIWKG